MFLNKLILSRTIGSANAALVNQRLGLVAELDEQASQLRVCKHDANALSSAGRSGSSLPTFLPHRRQCPWLLTRQLHLGSHLTFSVHTMALPLNSPGVSFRSGDIQLPLFSDCSAPTTTSIKSFKIPCSISRFWACKLSS